MSRATLFSATVVLVTSQVSFGQTFLDRAAWAASAGGAIVSPDFLELGPVNFASGVATDLGGFFDVMPTGGGPSSAQLNDVPNFIFDFDPNGLTSVTFTFDTPITAFAAEWSNTFVQDGFAVESGSGESYDLGAIGGNPLGINQFIGVVEADGFNTLTFTTATAGGDDFVFFTAFEFVEVPAPGGAAMLALGGLAALRRRR